MYFINICTELRYEVMKYIDSLSKFYIIANVWTKVVDQSQQQIRFPMNSADWTCFCNIKLSSCNISYSKYDWPFLLSFKRGVFRLSPYNNVLISNILSKLLNFFAFSELRSCSTIWKRIPLSPMELLRIKYRKIWRIFDFMILIWLDFNWFMRNFIEIVILQVYLFYL